MMNRRDLLKYGGALAAAAALPPADGLIMIGGSATTVAATQPIGINTESQSYATIEQPWLNIIKGATCEGAFSFKAVNTPWMTSAAGTSDTGEEAYLVLSSDGWPTTLVAGNGFSGTQVFTYAQIWANSGYSGSLPPPAIQWYPWNGVTYQAQIQGQGTYSFVGASGITVTSGASFLTVTGTQVASTLPSGQTGTITFTLGSGGLQIQCLAVNSSSNYYKINYIVNQAYISNYNAGEILSPDYKAALTGNGGGLFSILRTMGWQRTYQQEFLVTFTGNLANGATSGTISTLNVQGSSYTTWPFRNGTRKVVFSTGQVVNMTGTYGSAAVTWDAALSAAVNTSSVGGMAILSLTSGWSERALPGDATWASRKGPPIEVMAQACNELSISPWLCVPAAVPTIDSTYLSSLANLLFNGTGASVSGWNVGVFGGVAATQRCYVEYSNEVWNFGSGYQEANFCELMGVVNGFYAARGNNGPQGGAEFQGVQTAGIGDAFNAVYGSAMSTRVGVVMMQQSGVGNGSNFLQLAMNTPDWTSRAYLHNVYGYGCAPYFGPAYSAGGGALNSTDAATIAGLADPMSELFSLAYTNVGKSGNTYSSVPALGYLGWTLSMITNYIAAFNSYAWKSLPVLCYEGGLDLGTYSATALASDITAMARDSRVRYLNNDPTHQLSAAGVGYLPGMKANGVTSINMLNLCGSQWGQLELITQMEAYSSQPYTDMPRYQGDWAFSKGAA